MKHTNNNSKLAFHATLHCLLGCGLGEVVGIIIGKIFELKSTETLILAVCLGFVFGLSLGLVPLIRDGYSFKNAFKQVLLAEGLSIAFMEAAEVLTQIYMPGVMEASLNESIFWIGMLISLAAGFIAAFPVNYILIKKGFGHSH